MPNAVTLDALVPLLTEAFASVWGARLGGAATMAPSGAAEGSGWVLSFSVNGLVQGRLTFWMDREAAAATTRLVLALNAEPPEQEVSGMVRELLSQTCTAVALRPELQGLAFGDPTVRPGKTPAGVEVHYTAIPNIASCMFGFAIERLAAATANSSAGSDRRLEAVLDVELPLIVRFGRAVMPLKALAELGPGSVVDMGRSPDDPVELLVGDRLIARGEVVVVAGNYGVRITELSGGQDSPAMEGRLS
jgi:flagellar motor switch protein FliN